MKYSTKKGENGQVLITINHTASEVEESIQVAYRRAQKKLKIPGFRPGKAPLDMVEKKLGDTVYDDAARNLIGETFKSIVSDLELPPIDYPSFQIESFDRGKGAVFSGSYDTFPEIKLSKYKKLKATREFTRVPDLAVDEQIEEYRRQHGNLKSREEGEAVATGDVVTMVLEALDGELQVFQKDDFQCKTDEPELFPGLNQELSGKKISDSHSYETTLPDDFPEAQLAGRKITINFTIKNIQLFEYPDLNDEFAREVRECEGLTGLKEQIRKELNEKCEDVHNQRLQNELLNQIIETSTFTVPESLINREIQRRLELLQSRMGQKDLNLPEFASRIGQDAQKLQQELKEASLRGIKEELVLKEISKNENITTDDTEIMDDVKKRFGAMIKPHDIEKWLANPDFKKNVESSVINRKTLDWISENASVSSGNEVSYDKIQGAESVYP